MDENIASIFASCFRYMLPTFVIIYYRFCLTSFYDFITVYHYIIKHNSHLGNVH